MPFNNFHLFPNPDFVETGSYLGNGIQSAIDANVFNYITSIELSKKYYTYCDSKFSKYPHVKVFCGDSRVLLWPVIRNIKNNITFWLDGHWSGEDTADSDPFPLIAELLIIKDHPIKTHTILIDDVRLFETQFGVTKVEIEGLLKIINPQYQFTYMDGYVPNDVLVARII